MLAFILLAWLFSIDEDDKTHFVTTFHLGDSLYADKFKLYTTFSYTPSGEYSEYLTDSVSFRKYVGLYNDYSFFKYEKKGDSLIITTVDREDTLQVYGSRVYKLSVLKKHNIFE
jgi:hypothetical protein